MGGGEGGGGVNLSLGGCCGGGGGRVGEASSSGLSPQPGIPLGVTPLFEIYIFLYPVALVSGTYKRPPVGCHTTSLRAPAPGIQGGFIKDLSTKKYLCGR